jgi:hypothetical protein
LDYARVIGEPFPEGEVEIAKNPVYSLSYAKYVLHGRFLEGEPAIIESPSVAIEYASCVIKGRFISAEPMFTLFPALCSKYAMAMKLLGIDWTPSDAGVVDTK